MQLHLDDLNASLTESVEAYGRRGAYRRWLLLPDPYLRRGRYWVPEAWHGMPEFSGEPLALAVIPP